VSTTAPTGPSRTARRSGAHTAAALLNLVLSLVAIGLSMPYLWAGASASDAAGQPPFFIIVLSLVLGVAGVVSSYGIWVGQRWGVVLTIVLQALNFLSGAPGIVFGGSAFLVIGSIVGCIANVVIVYLLLRRRGARSTVTAEA
jgi:uncharacterized membrane protein (DUF2068 family)